MCKRVFFMGDNGNVKFGNSSDRSSTRLLFPTFSTPPTSGHSKSEEKQSGKVRMAQGKGTGGHKGIIVITHSQISLRFPN